MSANFLHATPLQMPSERLRSLIQYKYNLRLFLRFPMNHFTSPSFYTSKLCKMPSTMGSTINFALCMSSLILSVASHQTSHSHEMSHLRQQYMADNFIDVTTDSEFFGLGTFANVPYVNCLKPDESDGGRYDIAILGAPFDTVSYLFSRGHSHAQRISPRDAWSIYTGMTYSEPFHIHLTKCRQKCIP
jgi:hypothetical protein